MLANDRAARWKDIRRSTIAYLSDKSTFKMRWFGSKSSVVKTVFALARSRASSKTMCDPFGGIGIVGAYFKSMGFKVTTGDQLWAANCFQSATVTAGRTLAYRRLQSTYGIYGAAEVINYLNDVRNAEGWLVREYSGRRKFFTRSNAERIDGCRITIGRWHDEGLLSHMEHRVLLASLINSLDRVANTAGTYYAHLKQWHRKALKPFEFAMIPPTNGSESCRSVIADAGDLVAEQSYDILYLDPPYNVRCYAGYYHLPETIARSEEPITRGQSGIPTSPRPKSAFNSPKTAFAALESLLSKAKFKHLIFHYSDDGIIDRREIASVLSSYGRTRRIRVNAPGYSTELGARRTVAHVLYSVDNA